MVQFLEHGYAVVAPDYAGLGTTGRPEYLNKTAEANDVIGALRSARQARPELSGRWVLWGHSQGGGAALAVAEAQRRDPEAGYLGAVVTSPTADLTAIVSRLADLPGLSGSVPLIVQGAAYSDPRIHPARLLTPAATDRLSVARAACLNDVIAAYGDLSGSSLVRPGYLADPAFARYLERNATGRLPVGGPVLLLQGEADSAVPQAATDQVAAGLCHAGSRVDYRTYPGLAHDTYPGQVIGIDDGAMGDILAWTADRFADRPAGSTCA
jgi:alpha-beta hydrolase superfamily lysophospholipase